MNIIDKQQADEVIKRAMEGELIDISKIKHGFKGSGFSGDILEKKLIKFAEDISSEAGNTAFKRDIYKVKNQNLGMRDTATTTFVHKELLLAAWKRDVIEENDLITRNKTGGQLDRDADEFLKVLKLVCEVTPGVPMSYGNS